MQQISLEEGFNKRTKFKKAFITEPAKHDYDALMNLVEEIVFVTSGYEKSPKEISEILDRNLKAFDENRDIFVPTGKVFTAFLCGAKLSQKCSKMQIAIFSSLNQQYTPFEINFKE
jgi:hypothetical protein